MWLLVMQMELLFKNLLVIGLFHCKCGTSWRRDIGFFERTPVTGSQWNSTSCRRTYGRRSTGDRRRRVCVQSLLMIYHLLGCRTGCGFQEVSCCSHEGKHLRIYYMTQVSVKPPTFVIFVNDKNLTHFSYTRYIENNLRNTFGFRGTSLRFIYREREDSIRG